MSKPIYYIKNGKLSFADKIIFEGIELYLYPGEKVCLIGRNGCGKSSLMNVISKDYEMQEGEIYKHPTARISYLNQDNQKTSAKTIYDLILLELESESEKYKADIILDKLSIDGNDLLENLSGGQVRRAYLAKVLVKEPEILLLDEPTNHLDIIAIEWLEEYIKSYHGAVICISHDRSFLTNVTNKLWWLDRGVLRKSDEGFSNFENWRTNLLEYEESVLRKLNKKLEEENSWLNAGVTARRKRNQKRLADLIRLRETVSATNLHLSRAKQKFTSEQENDIRKSKFIIEAINISFGYEKPLIKDFSFRCKKGEAIGFIGPNGCGKSTLIKLLLKELSTETGLVRHGIGLEISYFDQYRSSLNPSYSLKQTLCPNGGDQIFLNNNKTMHVAGYLKHFMFDPKLLDAKVSTLSGGEANRLLLAKTLINPGNLLVLDEPTNDLDMDSLEILVEILSEYQGTIIIVSHDRDFIDRIVTRSIVFDMDGNMVEVVGGYGDYLKHYPKISSKSSKVKLPNNSDRQVKKTSEKSVISKKKLSYKEQRLLEVIPIEISKLEDHIKKIENKLSDVDLYNKNPELFNKLTIELQALREKIEELTNQWLQIECAL